MSGSSAKPSSRQTKPRRAGDTANCRPLGFSPGLEQPRLRPGAGAAAGGAPRRGAGTRRRRRAPGAAGRPARSPPRPARARRAPDAARRTNAAGPAAAASARVARRARSASGPPPTQTACTSSGDQTRSGARSNAGTRSSGAVERRLLAVIRAEVDLDELAPPLGGGIDRRLARPARSARCVNGENARICSISSPKSSMRSGSRPVVGKTSTSPPRTANWPALLDSLDPLVAGRGKLLGERVDPGLVARRDANDSRPLAGRRKAFRHGRRRCADETAALEHRERAGPLADEVRRRLEPRSPVDAARREQRDVLVAEEPAAASAASRASASSGSSTTRPRCSSSCRAARTSGSTGSETRARVGSAAASSWSRSSARRRSTRL